MIVEYNWEDITKQVRSNEGRLILFYCLVANQTRENKWLAKNERDLIKRLHISDVPYAMFVTQYILVTQKGIVSNYDCIDLQSYVKNYSFIFENVSTKAKIDYLELLSLRHLNNKNDWIPLNYARLPIRNNIFTETTKDKILFPYESEQD